MRLFRPTRGLVVYDVIDGQVLVIRSDTGAYYSLEGTAAQVWAGILATGDEAVVIESLLAAYPAQGEDVARDVSAFLDALLEERLVEPAAAGEHEAEVVEVPMAASWSTPSLESFHDMRDLLLFDPIHEVGPEGWPRAAHDRG